MTILQPKNLLYFIILCLNNLNLHAQYKVVPQTGHSNSIVDLEYSPNGQYLATGGHDRKILLWDTRTGLHWPIQKHNRELSHLAFSPDSKYLATGDVYGNRYVWETATLKLVASSEKNNEDASGLMQFISNEEIAISEKTIFKIWNFKTNQITQKIPLANTKFSLHPNLTDLLLLDYQNSYSNGSFNKTFKMTLYDRVNKKPIVDQWIRNQGSQWQVGQFSKTGNYLAMADANKVVLFNYKSKTAAWQLSLPDNLIFEIQFTADDSKILIATGYESKKLLVYDVKTGKELNQIANFAEYGIGYQPINQLIAGSVDASNYNHQINIYDLNSRNTIATYLPNKNIFYQIDWNDAEKKLYASGSEGIVVWDLSMAVPTNETLGFKKYDDSKGLEQIPNEYFNAVTLWKTGSLTIADQTISGKKTYKAIAVKNGEYNWSAINVHDNLTNRKLYSINTPIIRMTFSRDEKKLFVTTADDVTAYDAATGTLLHKKVYTDKSVWAIATNFNGQYLAVAKFRNEFSKNPVKYASVDFDIDLLSPADLSLIKTLSGHTAHATSMDFTPDGKYLISGGADGTIRFWDLASGKQKILIMGTSANDYFISNDEGYYSASKKAISKIAFANETGSLIPGELFEIQMNRPDKVVRSIGYADDQVISALQKAFEKRLSQLGITEQKLNINQLPQIKLLGSPPAVTSDVKFIEIEYEAMDETNKLSQLKLLINDVPIYGSQGLDIKNKNKAKGKLKIELTEGVNVISLSAINEKGASSIPITFNVFCRIKTKPNLYLITIGVDKFLDPTYNLDYSAKDAKDIGSMFNSRKADYNNITHLDFTGIQATKDRILSAKNTLANSKPDDQVVIFVATHGMFDSNYNYYLATYNMLFDKPELHGLAYSELEGMLDGIPARKKLILIDACHSGEVDVSEITASTTVSSTSQNIKTRGFKTITKTSKVGLENSFDLMKSLFADLRDGTGATVISSAGGVEFAFESDKWNNGVFTYALLEGIESKNADLNRDASITVSELQNYVFDRVNILTNGKQNPTARTENLTYDYPIVQSISNLASAFNITGTWKAIAETNYKGEFYQLKPGQIGDITISKATDGFYRINYVPGDGYKLTPMELNQYSTVTRDVISVIDSKTILIKGSYSTIKYQKN